MRREGGCAGRHGGADSAPNAEGAPSEGPCGEVQHSNPYAVEIGWGGGGLTLQMLLLSFFHSPSFITLSFHNLSAGVPPTQ